MSKFAEAQNIYRSIGIKALVKRAFIVGCDMLLEPYYLSKDVNNHIVLFESYPDFSDNSRVLFDYMVNNGYNKKYLLVWSVERPEHYHSDPKNNILFIPRHSLNPIPQNKRYWEYGRTAKWIFYTHGHPFGDGAKRNQMFVNLTHGGMGFKRNKDATHDTETECNDYCISPCASSLCIYIIGAFYHCKRSNIVPLGLPRNDLLFHFRPLGIFDSMHGKNVLWMPTFRVSTNPAFTDDTLTTETGLPILHTLQQLEAFNIFLAEKNVYVFIKLHPLQDTAQITRRNLSNIHILTNGDLDREHIQLYEIFNHFSAMISDYSSVSFDYLYLDRPLAYTLEDLEEYQETRGLVMDDPLNYMPGHHLYNLEDLECFIDDLVSGKDRYVSERERVRKLIGLIHEKNSCQKILDHFGLSL